jgi:hypothetical protein
MASGFTEIYKSMISSRVLFEPWKRNNYNGKLRRK